MSRGTRERPQRASASPEIKFLNPSTKLANRSVNMHAHTHTHMCTQAATYVYTYTRYKCTHTDTHAHTLPDTHRCTYGHIHRQTHTYTHTHIQAGICIHRDTHTYTHRYKYVHTYMCTQTDSSLLLFFSALHVSPSNTLLFYIFFTNSGSQLPGP